MKKINFIALDGIELEGILYNSQKETKKVILAVHGMSSNCFRKRDDIIAKHANENNIDYFCFNNRGSELVKYLRKDIDGEKEKTLGGMSFEDPLEGYEDIVGAILKLKEEGYTDIYIQGHSLGSTKIVYTYNQLKEEESDLLENIKGIILLSLIDIPTVLEFYLKENYDKYITLAKEKIANDEILEFMPKDSFIHPISPKTFLRYAKKNEDIDFINPKKDPSLEKINAIEVPLFMRWGTENEMITAETSKYIEIIKSCLKKECNINYIQGADHGYTNKEEELAKQIIDFII